LGGRGWLIFGLGGRMRVVLGVCGESEGGEEDPGDRYTPRDSCRSDWLTAFII